MLFVLGGKLTWPISNNLKYLEGNLQLYCTELFKLLIKDNTANLFWSLPETIKLPNHIASYHSLLLCRWFRSSMAVFDPDIQRRCILSTENSWRSLYGHIFRWLAMDGTSAKCQLRTSWNAELNDHIYKQNHSNTLPNRLFSRVSNSNFF